MRLLFGFLVGEREEHIDIGIGKEILASVAAQREQRDVCAGMAGKGPAPHFNEDTVHDSRAAADGSGSVSSTLTGLADKRHLPKILVP